MEDKFLNEVKKNKPDNKKWPPEITLKDEVKREVLRNSVLQGEIMKGLDISYSTVQKWIKDDDLKSTSVAFLLIVWFFLMENKIGNYDSVPDLYSVKY